MYNLSITFEFIVQRDNQHTACKENDTLTDRFFGGAVLHNDPLIQTSMTRKTLLDVSCKRFTDKDHYKYHGIKILI